MVIIFCNVFDFIIPALHGHGRGKRLGTCLVYAASVVVIVACVIGDGLSCPKLLYANKQRPRAI